MSQNKILTSILIYTRKIPPPKFHSLLKAKKSPPPRSKRISEFSKFPCSATCKLTKPSFQHSHYCWRLLKGGGGYWVVQGKKAPFCQNLRRGFVSAAKPRRYLKMDVDCSELPGRTSPNGCYNGTRLRMGLLTNGGKHSLPEPHRNRGA